MADVTKKVEIQIGAKDTSRGVLDSLEKRLNGIKRQFGRRGLFGDFGEILAGGGIVAGVTFLARELGNAAEKAGELASRYHAGLLSIKDMTGEISRSIPVLGQMVQMWDKVAIAAARAAGAPEGATERLGAWSATAMRVIGAQAGAMGFEGFARINRAALSGANRMQELDNAKAAKAAADAARSSRGVDIRSRIADILGVDDRASRLSNLSGGMLERQRIEEEYNDRRKRLNEALAELGKLGAEEAKAQRMDIEARLKRIDQQRDEAIRAQIESEASKTQRQIESDIREYEQNRAANRRSLLDIARDMVDGGSSAFAGFAPLQESRFGTGANDSRRESLFIQWQNTVADSMRRIDENARRIAEQLERNLDLTDVGALLG